MANLETKLLWFDRGAAAFEKFAPGVIEQVKGPGAEPHYVCPICLEGFVREDVANGILTEEHVPPEALGGRGLVLTCKICNNTAGTELDAHAHRQDTREKRTLIQNLFTNAGGTPLTPDDVVRLFIQWIDYYHEAHFAVFGRSTRTLDVLVRTCGTACTARACARIRLRPTCSSS